jgi:predicted nucleotidyltransferase
VVEKPDKILAKIRILARRLEENGIRLKTIYLYGSYAGGNPNEDSDIDLAIVSPDFKLDTMRDWNRVFRICFEVDPHIEPVLYRPSDLKKPHPLAFRIKKFGRLLYPVSPPDRPSVRAGVTKR